MLIQDTCAIDHKLPFSGTLVSTLHGTCIPMMYDLMSLYDANETSFPVNFERFTDRGFHLYSWKCQTLEVARQSRGLTRYS